jgi:hypothetical protein
VELLNELLVDEMRVELLDIDEPLLELLVEWWLEEALVDVFAELELSVFDC